MLLTFCSVCCFEVVLKGHLGVFYCRVIKRFQFMVEFLELAVFGCNLEVYFVIISNFTFCGISMKPYIH